MTEKETFLNTWDREFQTTLKVLKALPEGDFNKSIRFPVGPKQMGDVRRGELFWLMVMDGVHHRGQFSVYLRMAGGKVPSIYGPSADEPWM